MADLLRQKIMAAAQQANVTLCVALADHLGVFKALSATGCEKFPANFRSVAAMARLKPRYTKELLSALACGEIIQVAPDGEHYYIPTEAQSLFNGKQRDKCLTVSSVLPMHASVFPQIADVFKNDGPLGMDYTAYNRFYDAMDEFNVALHKKHLVPDLIPLAGVETVLKRGCRFLDVGCGGGFHVCELAAAFPRSQFTGIDLIPSAIKMANERKDSLGLKNVEFIEANAKSLNSSWSNSFDVVSIFDACHDQCRPDLALKEIHRVLAPGGTFFMIEIDGTSNVYTDIQNYGSAVTFFYTSSVMHCLPVGSNSPDALGLGTMMGVPKGTQLLREAGFNKIRVEDLPFFEFNVLYAARKDGRSRKQLSCRLNFS